MSDQDKSSTEAEPVLSLPPIKGMKRESLKALLKKGLPGSRGLDFLVATTLRPDLALLGLDKIPHYTINLNDALSLLPVNWYWTGGGCDLTGHTTIGPDYNGPAGEQLRIDWPVDEWDAGVSYDLSEGANTIDRICQAIICACCDVPDVALVQPPYHRLTQESASIQRATKNKD